MKTKFQTSMESGLLKLMRAADRQVLANEPPSNNLPENHYHHPKRKEQAYLTAWIKPTTNNDE